MSSKPRWYSESNSKCGKCMSLWQNNKQVTRFRVARQSFFYGFYSIQQRVQSDFKSGSRGPSPSESVGTRVRVFTVQFRVQVMFNPQFRNSHWEVSNGAHSWYTYPVLKMQRKGERKYQEDIWNKVWKSPYAPIGTGWQKHIRRKRRPPQLIDRSRVTDVGVQVLFVVRAWAFVDRAFLGTGQVDVGVLKFCKNAQPVHSGHWQLPKWAIDYYGLSILS